MNLTRSLILVVVAGVLGYLLWQWWQARPVPGQYDGYIEAEVQYFAVPVASSLQQLNVQRGQQVEASTTLFVMDSRGPAADLAQAQANLGVAAANWQRAQRLKGIEGGISQRDYDAARGSYQQAQAVVESAQHQLGQMAPMAPVGGVVENTFFNPGEWVGANTPVVSLISPQYLKVRFYVPQAELPNLKQDQTVMVSCDGCGGPLPARVNYLAPQAEFAPPVLYTQTQRQKLVFLVEARPVSGTALLHPGLPVTVRLH